MDKASATTTARGSMPPVVAHSIVAYRDITTRLYNSDEQSQYVPVRDSGRVKVRERFLVGRVGRNYIRGGHH